MQNLVPYKAAEDEDPEMHNRGVFFALCLLAAAQIASSFSPTLVQMKRVTAHSGIRAARCVRRMQESEYLAVTDRRKAISHFGNMGTKALVLGSVLGAEKANAAKAGPKLPEPEWEELIKSGKISKKAFQVLHNQATEKPFTSQLLVEKRKGTFACAACGTDLFQSDTKFDSGTGWPSFYDKLEGVETETGNLADQLVMRAEVHCVKCGGHLGHVFDDGWIWSVPTNKRYCINGLSLAFKPKEA